MRQLFKEAILNADKLAILTPNKLRGNNSNNNIDGDAGLKTGQIQEKRKIEQFFIDNPELLRSFCWILVADQKRNPKYWLYSDHAVFREIMILLQSTDERFQPRPNENPNFINDLSRLGFINPLLGAIANLLLEDNIGIYMMQEIFINNPGLTLEKLRSSSDIVDNYLGSHQNHTIYQIALIRLLHPSEQHKLNRKNVNKRKFSKLNRKFNKLVAQEKIRITEDAENRVREQQLRD